MHSGVSIESRGAGAGKARPSDANRSVRRTVRESPDGPADSTPSPCVVLMRRTKASQGRRSGVTNPLQRPAAAGARSIIRSVRVGVKGLARRPGATRLEDCSGYPPVTRQLTGRVLRDALGPTPPLTWGAPVEGSACETEPRLLDLKV